MRHPDAFSFGMLSADCVDLCKTTWEDSSHNNMGTCVRRVGSHRRTYPFGVSALEGGPLQAGQK
jgi:hypothetical protein